MSPTNTKRLRILTSALLTAGVVAVAPPAHAMKSFDKAWNALYPSNLTSTGDASCAVCHGTSNGNLNPYGAALCEALGGSVPADITDYLIAIANADSDGEGNTNSEEIGANAQPGWTEGSNAIYLADVTSCAYVGTTTVPSSVPLPYDPPAEGMPVAIPGGPYAGNVDVPITFDGSGSYDSDSTNVIEIYAWNFNDGTEVVITSEPTIKHTYAAAGTYAVSLTVTDDEGDTSTNTTAAVISGDAVLDLDIAALKVTGSVRVGKPIAIQLSVENPGTVLGQALATVTGMQDGAPVYEWSLNVYDNSAKGSTSFTFPSYVPTAKGTISWAATIADVDPDPDLATATTVVK